MGEEITVEVDKDEEELFEPSKGQEEVTVHVAKTISGGLCHLGRLRDGKK